MNNMNFENLGLSRESLNAVKDMGYEKPTLIQHESIPHILNGRDVIGHSQTGTGKTMAFGLPAIELCDPQIKATQALILCPTRELAEQAAREINKAATYKRGLSVIPIYGGASMENQLRQLRRGAHIVIGTPGRLMDHMRRRTLKLGDLKLLVLDEADEMLNMGFREDIETILEDVPESRTTVLFSATMSRGILQITKNYQTDAKLIKAVTKNLTVSTLDQYHIHVKKINKIMAVDVLIKYHQPKLTLIFCNTKRQVDELVENLQKLRVPAMALHGDLNQNARSRVMNGFRTGAMPILVATDVAARGIDVDDVEMVINFDVPQDDEYYVHRVGRTGRAGRSGVAITLISGNSQKKRLSIIERYIKEKIPQKHLPSKADIDKIVNEEFKNKLVLEIEKPTTDSYFKLLDELINLGYSERKIAATMIRIELESTQATIETNIVEMPMNDSKASGAREQGMVRFFMNVGRKDKASAKDIVGCIVGEAKISGRSIGKVDIYDNFSFAEVEIQYRDKVLRSINNNNVTIRNRKINIEVAKARK